jgi:lantibiotic modifying enzyme
LLQGALKERAQCTLHAIVDDLARLEHGAAGDPTLASGAAGLAILHAYLAQAGRGTSHTDAAVRCLNRAVAALTEKPMEASLYSGLTGVGWALAHLQSRLPSRNCEDDLNDIDQALLDHLEQCPWRDDYDLISGLVGFGVYALERLPAKAGLARRAPTLCLERVVDRLAEMAEYRAEGITWWTDPKWLPRETAEKYPHGYYNLGVAHGVPGVITFLGLVRAAGIAVGKCGPLLEGAMRWQLAHQTSGGFPAWIAPGEKDEPARLAWCYGDPGISAALLMAARGAGDSSCARSALTIAHRAAERPAAQAGVKDAGLCHGAAGLGHLFNRLFQATREPRLADAARFWFVRTLEMQRAGQGIGGYQAWQLGDKGEPAWLTDSGLLTGSVGIGLALLGAATTVEPAWDRMLLTAIPTLNN